MNTAFERAGPAALVISPMKANGEPTTTSEIIADGTGIDHRKIKTAIRKYKTELETFGKVAPYRATLPSGQRGTGYILNEQQATFLLTLLKNTHVVVAFKKELVRQFYIMREELIRRRELRTECKRTQRTMTDALQESGEVERMKGFAFSAYNNLALKLAVGCGAAQLRKQRGATRNATAVDYLTADELARLQVQEASITILLDAGLRYDAIKGILCRTGGV